MLDLLHTGVKKVFKLSFILIIAVTILGVAAFYWNNLRGIWPALTGPDENIAEILSNTTGMPLTLPDGFAISIFADNVPNARMLAFDGEGNLWISQTKRGTVTRLDVAGERVVGREEVFTGLNNPHGIAFDPLHTETLYIAEEHLLSKVNLSSREPTLEPILPLPEGGGHFTRTIRFGPDGRLYISIGSSCNVCREEDDRRAAIFSIGKGASDAETFATGLRNAVFFTWHPETGEMWATEMGRDFLGDDLPPDEINIVRKGKFYGWPVCYGKNIHDLDFDNNTYLRNPCQEPFEEPSYIDIPAHSAPLGLGFIPRTGSWSRTYWHDLIVAYHGSWNRTEPTGYKLTRIRLTEEGEFLGMEDFISGWITPRGKVFGRPVDILVRDDGTMYVSDDKAGVVYKITNIDI